ncbi:ChaN family lipoprotein [Caldimicrobium thiodismutans]|uniref:ChaN family lipoprotein n=1 Tax=Caldimicrobium thiodismutans TaxID=1653476 RepID=UPI000838CB8C|nr:ChaN family lipoprotein [Caldimicrobium thiodismutans]
MPSLFLFIFCLLFPLTLKAEFLKAQYELTLYPEKKLLQGNATFELNKEGVYEFQIQDLRIEKAKIGNETLRISEGEDRNYLKIYNFKKNATLTLTFERELPFKVSPLPQVLENYLPFPRVQLPLEISIQIQGKLPYQLILPYEEKEEKEGISVYRIKEPFSKAPPLILGSFKEKRLTLQGREFLFYLPKDFSEKLWEEWEASLKKGANKLQGTFSLLPYPRFYVFLTFERKSFPLGIFLPLPSDRATLINDLFVGLVEQILEYGLNFNDELLEGLKTYLTSYALSSDQKALRKSFLLNSAPKERAFFRLFEWINRLGEERFKKFWDFYLGRYLFNGSSNELFWRSAANYFKEPFPLLDLPFQRVSLKVKPEVKYLDNQKKYHLRLNISQEKTFRPLRLEVYLVTEKDRIFKTLYLNQKEALFDFYLEQRPLEVVLDPAYKIYRELSLQELPLGWNILKESDISIYLSQKELLPVYREFLENLRKRGAELNFGTISFSALPLKNLLFLETPPQGFHLPLPEEGIYFKILPHPNSSNHFLAFAKISSLREWRKFKPKEDSVKLATGFLFQSGKFLYNFKAELRDGLSIRLDEKEKVFGAKSSQILPLDEFFPEWLGLQALLIGETHDRYEHHRFQLEVIKGLHHYFKDLTIGLEMVQSPFQKHLDDFVEGRISEKELLERIEYYDRWRFDYRLYRDIFLYAREHKLKLLALDVPQEIVKKVAKTGFSDLTEEEKKYLPEMDLYNPAYKDFLKGIFESHRFDNSTNFESFYQAQLLRDEAMAERIFEYLKKNPERKIIVITGKGHLQYYYGIPHALKRRNFTNFKTIILGETEDFKPSLGDYWFNPAPVEYEKTLQLGVILDETSEGLKIKEVLKDSLAERSGLRAGDILLKADERTLKRISDLKIVLTFKEKGSELALTFKRENENKRIQILLK